MKPLRLTLLSALIMIMAALTSCEHKELCYVHPHATRVKVVFDWQNAPEANPASMVLYLFPIGGGAPELYEFVGRDGGVIDVFPGDYTAMCMNSSTENLAFNNLRSVSDYYQNCELYEVTTSTTELLSRFASSLQISSKAASLAPRAEGTDDQRIALEPDSIWTDSATPIDLSYEAGTVKTITLYPSQAFCHYTVRILNIENVRYLTGLTAALSGQAGGIYPVNRRMTEETVTIPFEFSFDTSAANARSELLTFGHHPSGADDQVHYLTVYASLNNGSKIYCTYDVTDQIHSAPDPQEVEIVIGSLPLPEPVGDSGLSVEVEEWDDTEIDLNMRFDS